MKTVLLAAMTVLATSAPALADEDAMRGYLGNTLIVKSGMSETHLHLRSDHTFDVTATILGMNVARKGTWKIDERGQLCRWLDHPPAGAPNPSCTVLASHRPGDTWTMTANGKTATLTLVSGVR